jgi:recombination protein RecR
MRPIRALADLIAEFPGVGPRQARRVVQFLLRADHSYKKRLVEAIESLEGRVSQCVSCFRFDEVTSVKLCPLCADASRDDALLMVVEKDVDIDSVEAAGIFKGRYFVLGSLIPLARARKSAISPRTKELSKSVAERKKAGLKEVVLAFATTPDGDYTARELKKEISEKFPEIKVSLLGRGLSLGAEIEYADQETLRSALQGRSESF